MNKITLITGATALLAVSIAHAKAPDVQLLHSMNGAEHCYRVLNHGNKPLREISVGSSWDGHPIKDSIKLELTDKPAGWSAKHEVRSRHGYQFVLLTPPSTSLTAGVFPKGYIGRVCMRLSDDVEGMQSLPYAFQLDGEPNRTVGKAINDDGRVLRPFDQQVFEKDGLEETADKVDKARDATDAVRKLNDLF